GMVCVVGRMRDLILQLSKSSIYSTKPLTAAKNLAEAFEHYNEWHPHSALGYRSPREYLRRRTSNGLSDKKCLEI
ncbi:integrase core domain-containing protein, partial [Klebsiella pneumoniae]